jgi:hypothetical protein
MTRRRDDLDDRPTANHPRGVILRLITVMALAGSVCACTSTKLAGNIEGEPVCEDFELSGGNVMKGSLKYPVKVTILEDDDPLWERVVYGKRKADSKGTIFAIADDDEEYVVRFAQCPNQFAPKPVDAVTQTTDRVGSYVCGEPEVYEETKLVIREGDASSRKIQWVTPPQGECWTATPNAATSSSASAEPAPEPPPEPEPEPSASASTSASAAASAEEAPEPPDPEPPKPAAPKPPAPKPPAPKPPAPKPPAP